MCGEQACPTWFLLASHTDASIREGDQFGCREKATKDSALLIVWTLNQYITVALKW